MSDGWIGVDLDGTLAEIQPGEFQPEEIGKPISKMINRVKRWISENKEVRIVTARVASISQDKRLQEMNIRAWCQLHIGQAIPVTAEKDYRMIALFDDRVIQVEPNTGRILGNDFIK